MTCSDKHVEKIEECEGSCENSCPGDCKENEDRELGVNMTEVVSALNEVAKSKGGSTKFEFNGIDDCKENEASEPYEIAKELITTRQLKGNRMGINDDICNTNLISKNYSAMFIRKFNPTPLSNWPLYVAMICDEDVSEIDRVVNGALRAFKEAGYINNNLQNMRNLTGVVSETLSIFYDAKKENCVEGIAVTLYVDKAYIQSFTGDFMNHGQCRSEYTSALNMMTQI
jgi:hypothetical protein